MLWADKNSLYAEKPTEVLVGHPELCYYVPQHLLQSTKWSEQTLAQIRLPDIDADTGHTLVHYLYTGTYQTLDARAEPPVTTARIQFERALMVYLMTIAHDLSSLRHLAICEIEEHGAWINIFEVLEAIKDHFAKLSPDSWVHDYVRRKAKAEFERDHTIFNNDCFLEGLGDPALAKFMMGCVMDLYDDKISRFFNIQKDITQKLDDRNEITCDLPIVEAIAEKVMEIQATIITTDVTVLEECCGEEAFEEDIAAIEESCTISCSSSECPSHASPVESLPIEECYALSYPVSECSIEVNAATMGRNSLCLGRSRWLTIHRMRNQRKLRSYMRSLNPQLLLNLNLNPNLRLGLNPKPKPKLILSLNPQLILSLNPQLILRFRSRSNLNQSLLKPKGSTTRRWPQSPLVLRVYPIRLTARYALLGLDIYWRGTDGRLAKHVGKLWSKSLFEL